MTTRLVLLMIGLATALVVVAGVTGSTHRVASQEIATGIQEDEFSIRVEPEHPVAGEHFAIIADLIGRGGLSSVSLNLVDVDPDTDGQDNIVNEQDGQSVWGSSVIGGSWRMYATQPGEVTVSVYANYEKVFLCDEMDPPIPNCIDFTSFVGDTRTLTFDVEPDPDPLVPNADANEDGEIDSLDALHVLQAVAGLLPGVSGEGEVATVSDSDVTLSVTPAHPKVGSHFDLTATVPTDDERIDLYLSILDADPDGDGEDNIVAEPPEHFYQSARLPSGHAPNHSVRFYALEEGPVSFRGGADVVKVVECDNPDPPAPDRDCPYNWVYTDSAELTVDIGPARLPGDADDDGEVGSVDAALILQFAAGLIENVASS